VIELSTLYSKDAKDNILLWRTWTEEDVVCYEHGQVGKKLVTHRDRQQATNTGRANMRTPAEQADFVAQSAWDKKKKQGYQDSIEAAKTAEVLLPMLAQPLVKKTRKNGVMHEAQRDVKYPCDAQRKLNGLRCLAIMGDDCVAALKSRQGTEWDTLTHIESELALIGDIGDIFDGEIYLHGTPLQTINGWVKNGSDAEVASCRTALQYCIYDMPRINNTSPVWEERHKALKDRYVKYLVGKLVSMSRDELAVLLGGQHASYEQVRHNLEYIWAMDPVVFHPLSAPYGTPSEAFTLWLTGLPLQLVRTFQVENEHHVKTIAKVIISEGYEGVILRQRGWDYTFRKRKEALIKWKDFCDEEFNVVDMTSREYFPPGGDGDSIEICDVAICRNNLNAETFETVPMGTIEDKQRYWNERDKYIGSRAMVRYLERSVDGIPQGNPVLTTFRLDDDTPEEEDDMAMWS
jgi:hypothetical protein